MPDDIHEDQAAETVAKALAGGGIEITAPFTGRCNHFAREAGRRRDRPASGSTR